MPDDALRRIYEQIMKEMRVLQGMDRQPHTEARDSTQ
jgi:hypothetical protein